MKLFDKIKIKKEDSSKETSELKVEENNELKLSKKEQIIKKLDTNCDGVIGADDIIAQAMRIPGVKINREDFLRKEFKKICSEEQLNLIIEQNPIRAGIDNSIIEKLADETIKYERTGVSGISAALSVPGGLAMVATLPADIIQYYGFMLRAAQKLMYLYGYPEMIVTNEVDLDTVTVNALIICLGVMYGVGKAKTALLAISKALANGVEKKLLKTALTKGTIYPIVKSVSKWFGVRMTKTIFASGIKKAIPIVGGLVGGALTFFTFKPCCDKLRTALIENPLNDPNYVPNEEEKDIIIDAEVVDVVDIDDLDEE